MPFRPVLVLPALFCLIPEELRAHLIKSLHQTGRTGKSQDGMDLALCFIDLTAMKIEFSGANNSIWIFRPGEMMEKKADKMPIGIYYSVDDDAFSRHDIDLQQGDTVCAFTDGYLDRSGGPLQKKFMIKNFREMLKQIHHVSLKDQKRIMIETMEQWMAAAAKVDDILVAGVRMRSCLPPPEPASMDRGATLPARRAGPHP